MTLQIRNVISKHSLISCLLSSMSYQSRLITYNLLNKFLSDISAFLLHIYVQLRQPYELAETTQECVCAKGCLGIYRCQIAKCGSLTPSETAYLSIHIGCWVLGMHQWTADWHWKWLLKLLSHAPLDVQLSIPGTNTTYACRCKACHQPIKVKERVNPLHKVSVLFTC